MKTLKKEKHGTAKKKACENKEKLRKVTARKGKENLRKAMQARISMEKDGNAMNSPSMRPTRIPPMGPSQGISEITNAAEAALIPRTSIG